MMKVYTEEQKEFLRNFIPGHTTVEVVEEFNRRFEQKTTTSKIKSYKTNHKIRSGTFKGKPKGSSEYYPAGFRAFLIENNEGKTAAEITALLNEKFGTNYSVGAIKGLRTRMHLISGLTGRFEKGHIPPNKGRKGYCSPGCEKTWFKKGNVPHNYVPVGTESISSDGYLKIKVAEPNKWRFKHILEWEKHNGKVPDGCMISFKDGNHYNCSIENLMCITMTENAILNRQGLRSSSPDITESALALAKVKHRINEIKQKGPRE